MAAELKLVQPDRKVTLIHSRSKLLSSENLPDDFKDRALLLLQEAGVETIMGARVMNVSAVEEGEASPVVLTLSDGRKIKVGFVINAVSKFTPTSSYLPSAALDKEGYVKITPS